MLVKIEGTERVRSLLLVARETVEREERRRGDGAGWKMSSSIRGSGKITMER